MVGLGEVEEEEGTQLVVRYEDVQLAPREVTVHELQVTDVRREGDWVDVPFDLPVEAARSGLSQYELLTTLGRRLRGPVPRGGDGASARQLVEPRAGRKAAGVGHGTQVLRRRPQRRPGLRTSRKEKSSFCVLCVLSDLCVRFLNLPNLLNLRSIRSSIVSC